MGRARTQAEKLAEALRSLPSARAGLPTGERVALIDFIERYWAAKARGGPLSKVPSQQRARGKAARR